MFVFDGGVLTAEAVAAIEVHDDEIGRWRFVDVDEIRSEMRHHVWRRLRAAVDSLTSHETRYLERSSRD